MNSHFKTMVMACAFAVCVSAQAGAATIRELYEQAVDAYNKQDYDSSINFYQQITKEAPHFAPAYVGIGLALKAKGGDIDEVVYYYKTATEMDPTNVQAFEQLGRLYYSLNKYDKAEKAFLKALKIDPSLNSVKLSLGWVYLLGRSKPETAVRYFKDVVKTEGTPNAYLGLGMAHFANNNRTEAMEIITQLKSAGHNDVAERLEQMVRENQRIVLQQETSSEAEVTPAEPNVQSETVSTPQTGIKVRLRGKLSDV